jgi:hypothetical protein
MIKSYELPPIENREKALKKLEPLMACIQTVKTDTDEIKLMTPVEG